MAEKKLTVRNIDREIKKRTKKDDWKGTKEEIRIANKFSNQIKKKNAKIRYEVKKLKQEQLKRGTTKERIREIDNELKLSKYKTISQAGEKNYMNMLQGKDFYHIVDNGFSVYKIKNSDLVKQKNIGLSSVEKIIEDMADIEKDLRTKLKNKHLSEAERTRYKSMLKGIKKLNRIATKNQEALEENDFTEIEQDEESYPLLVQIQGDTIRINA